VNIDWPKVGVELGKTLFVFAVPLAIVPLLIWLERRICAGIQGRIGPNRVGPFGLLQPLADVIKLMFKEDITPKAADKFLYTIAPLLAYAPPLIIFGLLPVAANVNVFGIETHFPAYDLGIGLVLFMALTSVGVYGVTFGGWASNNKYSLLGGLRSSAQMISYELVLTLSLIAVMMQAQSISLSEIIADQQSHGWNILPWRQPLAAILFYIAALAENKRLPFDLPEAEPELVGGYHTEYSSMKFAMFFMGEYIAVMAMSGLFVVLFLGGWSFPGIDPKDTSFQNFALSFVAFMAKVMAVITLTMWIRWTLPRFKYTRLMELSWKGMIPLAFLNLAATAAIWAVTQP
jgi:NADH-quinone oxidoreductase subunit H